MKKFITLILGLSSLFINAQSNEIKISENTEQTYFLLKKTIKDSTFGNDNGSFTECWIKSKSKKSVVVKKKTYKNTYQMTKVMVNCYNDQFKFLEVVTYSEHDIVLKSSKYSEYEEFINAVPESTGDDIVKGVCENK